mgnify:CR=1 FL=1
MRQAMISILATLPRVLRIAEEVDLELHAATRRTSVSRTNVSRIVFVSRARTNAVYGLWDRSASQMRRGPEESCSRRQRGGDRVPATSSRSYSIHASGRWKGLMIK